MTEVHRIGLEDMDSSKYFYFGSIFIFTINASLFPLDTLTTILMADPFHSTPILKKMSQITRQEGILRFWRGWIPSGLLSFSYLLVLGAFPGQATYYFTYESTQTLLRKFHPPKDHHPSKLDLFYRGFLAGAMSEMMAGTFYVPSDVLSQKLQVNQTVGFIHNSRLYKGPTDVIKKIYKYDGIKGFYRGYLACILNSFSQFFFRHFCLCTWISRSMGYL
jgi:hypothetical protein